MSYSETNTNVSSLRDIIRAEQRENAKQALCQLKAMVQLRPDGIWAGD
jgi:hypothetical protein